MKKLFCHFVIAALVSCSFLVKAQTPTKPATTLPKKTLAQTLGLPPSTKTAPPSATMDSSNVVSQVDPTAVGSLPNSLKTEGGVFENPANRPSGGTLIIEKKPVEFSSSCPDCNGCPKMGASCPLNNRPCSLDSKRYSRQRGAYLSFFYAHSRWNDFTSALDDGSLGIELGSTREIFNGFEGGLGLGWFSGVPDTASGQNQYYAFYLAAKTNWEILSSDFTPTLGLDFNFGSYKIWAVAAESSTDITYSKLSSGTLFGLTPHLGMRFKLTDHAQADLNVGYIGFTDAPQWRVGGWMTGLTLSIKR